MRHADFAVGSAKGRVRIRGRAHSFAEGPRGRAALQGVVGLGAGANVLDNARSFVTIVGTTEGSRVTVRLGPRVIRMLGADGIPETGPGGSFEVVLGPFDVAVITADAEARVSLDGREVAQQCEQAAVSAGDGAAERVVYRCALSLPTVVILPGIFAFEVQAGLQHDGVHHIEADRRVGLVVYGFDRYISYAYPGGLDLGPLF